MNGEERRKKIIKRLQASATPISASFFSKEFSVTRQIIVADIALLRAAGYAILANNAGYSLDEKPRGILKRVVVKHSKNDVREEFYAIVDNGGKVLDVIVEHSVYGKISVELNIRSRYDADEFVRKIDETGANPLSLLTEGLHIHTIEVQEEKSFARIVEGLAKLNILIEAT
ncbi:MAG: transcription repressor NadR [Clostridia bacterium]|nr:transcription repressor NadR [Clostridia bacterium]